jgi:uncharacterized cofD-like protein
MKRPRIVTIGGGTGHYSLLTGLRDLDANITSIVTMMDSGGSSGRLRDEYGILPPGDFTRCLVALSAHPDAMKELLSHRFVGGSLDGHTVRNVIFTALQQITSDTEMTVERLQEVFAVDGRVLPVTLDRVELVMHLQNDHVYRGEATIDGLVDMLEAPVLSVYLDPPARAFGPALEAIAQAELIVIGPGDLYTSVLPNLVVRGVREAIAASPARKLYVCNLMTKKNETPGYTVSHFVSTVELYLGGGVLDAVLFNDNWPTHRVELYAAVGSEPVKPGNLSQRFRSDLCVGRDLLTVGRFIRHDPHKLARAIVDLAREQGWW